VPAKLIKGNTLNFKIKNRKLLNADIISPEIEYAEFSDELTPGTAERLVNSMNQGDEMMMIYKQMRDDMHIANVLNMLERMEHIYAIWTQEDFNIRRGVK